MKFSLIVLCIVLVSISINLKAQTPEPRSIDLKTLPDIPQINQPFNVVIYALFSSGGGEYPNVMGVQIQEKDSTITINIFYDFRDALPSLPSQVNDTVLISNLNSAISKIIVNPYCVNYIDTAAKGDADTLYLGTTGISENAFNNIQIYPNPASDNIFIENEKGLFIEELYLSDSRGRRIKTFDSPSGKLDVSDLAAGQYILNFLIEDQIFSRKILVQ